MSTNDLESDILKKPLTYLNRSLTCARIRANSRDPLPRVENHNPGADVATMSAEALAIVGNPAVLAIHQDNWGVQGSSSPPNGHRNSNEG